MAESKKTTTKAENSSDSQPTIKDLRTTFAPSSDKKTAAPPGKITEALQGKLNSVVETQLATETPSPGGVRDELAKTKGVISDQEFLHEFASQIATLYSNLRTDTIRFQGSQMPLVELKNALLAGAGGKVEQYGKQSGELSPLLVDCVKSARSLKEGLDSFNEALITIRNDQKLPKSTNKNVIGVMNKAVFDKNASLLTQASDLCEVLDSVNGNLKTTSQALHIAFDAEDLTALFQEVVDRAADLEGHLEEKEGGTTKEEQALAGSLAELRAQLLTQLAAVQAASGDRQRLLDQKKLTKSIADTLQIRWGAKKESDGSEASVPAALGKQQRELAQLEEKWLAAQAATEALQAQIAEERGKAGTLKGHLDNLNGTQEQVGKFAEALKQAKQAFKDKGEELKAGKGKNGFTDLSELANNYAQLLGFLKQMEINVNGVLLSAEKEFGEDPFVAALAPLKSEMENLAEPAGTLLDKLIAAQFTLDAVRGSLDDIEENVGQLEDEMNGSDALLTNFSSLALNKDLAAAHKKQADQVAILEKDLAKKEKAETELEESYETAKAAFDFEMMLAGE